MPLRLLAPLAFAGLVAFCTFAIWPLYKSGIERDLTHKVQKVYTNQIHDIPEVSFDGLQLKIDTQELTPYRRRKIDRIKGVYLPSGDASSLTAARPEPQSTDESAGSITELTTPPPTRAAETFLELTRADRTIWLRGKVPSREWTTQLSDSLKAQDLASRVIVEASTVEGQAADAWWHDRLAEILPDLLKKTHGHLFVSVGQDNLNLLARSDSQETIDAIQQSLASLPAGISVQPTLLQQERIARRTAPPRSTTEPGEAPKAIIAGTSIETLGQVLSATTIRFRSGMSILNRQQKRALSNLAAVIQSTADPSLVLMVGSYAASQSKQATQLGLKRTATVRQELISLGVPSTSLLTGHFRMKKGTRRRVEVTIATPDQIAAAPAPKAQPATPAPAPPEEPAPPAEPASPFEKVQVSFGGSGSAWLHPRYNPRLKELVELAQSPEYEAQTFAVESVGTSSPELSKLRAEAVLAQLVTLGLARERLITSHRPEREPGEARHVRMVPATPEQVQRAKDNPEQQPKVEVVEPEKADPETTPESENTEPEVPPTPEVVFPPPPPPSPFSDLSISFGGGGSSWLHPKFESTFDQVAELLAAPENADRNVIVVAYGTDNPELARLRAEAVRASLLKRGISGTRMTTDSRSLSQEGVRRVEVIFSSPEEKTDPIAEPAPPQDAEVPSPEATPEPTNPAPANP